MPLAGPMPLDIERIADILRETAAEEMMPRFAGLDTSQIAEKSPGDLVTAIDLAMERRLSRVLVSELPGSVILGEEAASLDPTRLDLLSGERPVWVVDPLDGTGNFAAGLPLFAVIIALIVDGATRAGWIYDPVSGRLATAEEGGGAWMAGRRLRVAHPSDLRQMNGAIYGRRLRHSDAYRQLWGEGRGPLGQVFNTRCVGQEYLARLQGGMHFGVYTRLNAWDHAAGCLLHREAGGHVARFDGTPYCPGIPQPGILVAPDREVWELLHEALIAPAAP